MTISKKVKLVSGLNKTENISNFLCSFSVNCSKGAGNSRFPTPCSFSLIVVDSGPHLPR